MGQPDVHFEIMGRDAEMLQNYYSDLFGWEVNADNPMKYGIGSRYPSASFGGELGIGGGVRPRS